MSASCHAEISTRPTPRSTLMRQDLGDLGHGASRGSDGSKVHGHWRCRVPTSQQKSSSPLCSPPRYGDLSGVARRPTLNGITPLLCTLLHPSEALSCLSCSSCEGYTCLPWNIASSSQLLILQVRTLAQRTHCHVIRHLSSTLRSHRPQRMQRTSPKTCTSSSWRKRPQTGYQRRGGGS